MLTMRLASASDEAPLKDMYRTLVVQMYARDLAIWDDVYPVEFLADDIAAQRLSVFEDACGIVGACALSESPAFDTVLDWNVTKRPLYLDRLGVCAEMAHRGVGTQMLACIERWAQSAGYDSLRLFVATANEPAIGLYKKCGFTQLNDVHYETFEDGFVLSEFGFQKVLA